jgi:predicted secreted Zn-dependent protease
MTEVDLSRAAWRTSHRSQQNGACVEVATNLPGVAAVRDSKNPDGAVLTFSPAEWAAFIAGVRDGELNH